MAKLAMKEQQVEPDEKLAHIRESQVQQRILYLERLAASEQHKKRGTFDDLTPEDSWRRGWCPV